MPRKKRTVTVSTTSTFRKLTVLAERPSRARVQGRILAALFRAGKEGLPFADIQKEVQWVGATYEELFGLIKAGAVDRLGDGRYGFRRFNYAI